MLLYQCKTLKWDSLYALGLGHIVIWSLVGFSSPWLLDRFKETPTSLEKLEKSKATDRSHQMMALSSIVLSLTGVSFLAFTFYRAGYHVKEIFYRDGNMIIRNHRPFGSIEASYRPSSLTLQEPLVNLGSPGIVKLITSQRRPFFERSISAKSYLQKMNTICVKSRRQCNQHIIEEEVEIIKEGILILITIDGQPSLGYCPTGTMEQKLLETIKNPQLDILENIGDIKNILGYTSCFIDSISSIKIAASLTLFRGKPAAITLVKINGDSDSTTFPDIWFEPVADYIETPDEVVDFFKFWFSMFNRDLISLNDDTNIYYVTEKGSPRPSRDRWPESLSKPPDEFMRIGEFGMGILGSVFGSPAKTKLEDVGFEVLEQFAKVTHFAKDKTAQALEHPLASPLVPLIPHKMRSRLLSTREADALIKEYESSQHYLARFSQDLLTPSTLKRLRDAPLNDTTHDFDSIRKRYQFHFSGTPLTEEKWKSWHNPEGFLTVTPYYVACTIFCGGIEPSLRKELWPRILGVIPWSSSIHSNLDEKEREYSAIKTNWMKILADAGDCSPTKITTPHEGTVGDENENADVLSKLTERFYRIDKDVARTDQNVDFFKLSSLKSARTSLHAPLRNAIDATPNLKRLRNVLMSYTVYNFELGYVQGMNDLCSPLLETIHDESLTFWTYCGIMEKLAPNFNRDQNGMRKQLRWLELLLKVIDPPLYDHFVQTDSANMFCTFRWLLILFKREFEFEELKTLWEVLWTCPFCTNFHLFVAIAILNDARQELFICHAFDEVLKTVNLLSHKIVVPDMIQRAEILYYLFRDRLASDGPMYIVKALDSQLATSKIETTLCEISGIARSELVLDGDTEIKREPYLSDQEWLEIVEILEMNPIYQLNT